MDTDEASKITLLGRDHHLTLPPSFFAREALVNANVEAAQTGGLVVFVVLAAAIGLSTRLGRKGYADVDLAKCRFDIMVYGERVYEWLRSQGVTHEQLVELTGPVLKPIYANVFPSDAEVAEAQGK